MLLDLTEEQRLVRQTAAAFARNEVLPRAAEIDREHRFPSELVARMGDLGFMGIAVPERYGGAGMDTLTYALVMEEISRACAACGVILSVNNSLACGAIDHFGTEDQKLQWLAPLATGEKLGCFALSEPEAGSDAGAQRTIARRVGDRWIISGVKNWITNGPKAQTCILATATTPEKKTRGVTTFLLPLDAPGLRWGPLDDKMGIRGSHSAQLFLDDVELTDAHVLGEVDGGFKVAMATLDGGRIGIAAQALGIARAAFEESVLYARDRKTFGVPIGQHQAIQLKLADMATRIDAARLLIWQAAARKDAGERFTKEAAMAKLFASETANLVAREAIQIFGGYGYMEDYPVARHYRDAKITEIYEGTSEIQRFVIAGQVLKE